MIASRCQFLGSLRLTSVLIPTRGTDSDATFVAAAIRAKGHDAQMWMTADFPSIQTQTMEFSGGEWRSSIHSDTSDFSFETHDVVWFRRPAAPYLTPIAIAPQDRTYLSATSRRYHQDLWHCLGQGRVFNRNTFWVNELAAVYRAESKMLQIDRAASVGFKVPRTLVSNDVAEISDFITGRSRVIRKSLILFHWLEDGKSCSTMASPITVEDLTGEGQRLSYCDIYQEFIPKTSELRTFIFGNTFFTVEVRPEPGAAELVDFRVLHKRPESVRPVELPSHVKEMCLALLRSLGLVSAVIEIMVEPSGDYVFTEVNQGGQFLWITNHDRDSAVLDAFSEFLIAKDPNFEWEQDKSELTVSSIQESGVYQELLNEEKEGLCPEPFSGI
jgi:hypothetical protein